MAVQRTPDTSGNSAQTTGTSFRHWRFILTTSVLAGLGFGFLYFCKPEPQQKVIFLSLLFMILFETFQVGWYKSRRQEATAFLTASDRGIPLLLAFIGSILFFGGILSLLYSIFYAASGEVVPIRAIGIVTIVVGFVLFILSVWPKSK